ncbi:MAG: hypothetical protein CL678_03325 [Bdellovibrionaceae bacterium]|nr:hypothetical protein [Pseudobdellovibrionaceae bacterium]|tara:strand:- start:194 stop:1540 length:1347 start_codon:yes stop_codon:yes gene_type:complete
MIQLFLNKIDAWIQWCTYRFKDRSEDKYRRAKNVVVVCLLASVTWPFFGIQYISFGGPVQLWGYLFLISFVEMSLPIFFRFCPSLPVIGNIMVFFNFSAFVWVAYNDGGVQNQALTAFPFLVILVITFSKRLFDILIWTTICTIILFLFYYSEVNWGISYPRLVEPSVALRLLFVSIASTIFVFTGIVYYYEKSRNRLNEELQEKNKTILSQQDMLVNFERLSALGNMSGGLAHEMNTPLTTVYTSASALVDEMTRDEPRMDRLSKHSSLIKKNAAHMSELIKALRTFGRKESIKDKKREDLKEIAKSVVQENQERFKENQIELRLEIPEGAFFVECNIQQIAQVLSNLLSNSFDAVVNESRSWVSVSLLKEKEEIVLAVMDSGPGISSEIQGKLFEPFFTTKPVGSGTGLGLSLSKSLVEANGGKLRLDFESKNTRFILSFPLESEE